MRSDSGTKPLPPGVVTVSTNSRIARLALPGFHEGKGSAAAEGIAAASPIAMARIGIAGWEETFIFR